MKCEHRNKSFVHVQYKDKETPCEWTLTCSDCKEVLGFMTNTIKYIPVPVGIDIPEKKERKK